MDTDDTRLLNEDHGERDATGADEPATVPPNNDTGDAWRVTLTRAAADSIDSLTSPGDSVYAFGEISCRLPSRHWGANISTRPRRSGRTRVYRGVYSWISVAFSYVEHHGEFFVLDAWAVTVDDTTRYDCVLIGDGPEPVEASPAGEGIGSR